MLYGGAHGLSYFEFDRFCHRVRSELPFPSSHLPGSRTPILATTSLGMHPAAISPIGTRNSVVARYLALITSFNRYPAPLGLGAAESADDRVINSFLSWCIKVGNLIRFGLVPIRIDLLHTLLSF